MWMMTSWECRSQSSTVKLTWKRGFTRFLAPFFTGIHGLFKPVREVSLYNDTFRTSGCTEILSECIGSNPQIHFTSHHFCRWHHNIQCGQGRTFKPLDNILTRQAERNLIINIEKSEFLKEKISYLGFEFSNGNYRPGPKKFRNFREWKIPTTKTQLQKILETVNWYRSYINNISGILSHLYDKLKRLKRNTKVEPDEMKEIHEIYDELKHKAKIYFPDMSKILMLNTDASEKDLGAILYQGQWIIAHYSKKLFGS